MNCRDAENMLTAFHEGRLSPEQRTDLEQHLGSCRQCRAAEQQFRDVHERLEGLFKEHKLPEDFDSMVLNAIETGQEPLRQPAFSWRALGFWGSIAAAAALGITLILASMWQVGEIPVLPDSTKAVEESEERDVERRESPVYRSPGRRREKSPAVPHEQPEETRQEVEVARRDAGTGEAEKPVATRQEKPRETSPGSDGGHGRPGDMGAELLASPQERGGGRPQLPEDRRKQPDGQRVGPRRPGQDRRNGEGDNRRELAERIRRRREAQRESEPPEVAKLDPEERRKLGSIIKESTDKGVPPAIAARVAQIVLKKGLTADDARKALRALNEAVAKGVRPGIFTMGLERMLGSLPEGMSFERALRRLVESLGSGNDNGKTN